MWCKVATHTLIRYIIAFSQDIHCLASAYLPSRLYQTLPPSITHTQPLLFFIFTPLWWRPPPPPSLAFQRRFKGVKPLLVPGDQRTCMLPMEGLALSFSKTRVCVHVRARVCKMSPPNSILTCCRTIDTAHHATHEGSVLRYRHLGEWRSIAAVHRLWQGVGVSAMSELKTRCSREWCWQS